MQSSADAVVERLIQLRQHQHDGKRSPHKPLLVLLALGQLASTGTSALRWSQVEGRLARLLEDYGPPSRTSAAQGAAYPFTRMRTDGIWILDHDVPMDRVRPLAQHDVVGRLAPNLEVALADSRTLHAAARALVDAEFPATLAADVLADVGFDPDLVMTTAAALSPTSRGRRDSSWPARILTAWDRQCAFCGYDGQLGRGSVGIEAAHVRWFTFDGPDTLDNGLALCSLHHKLFDRGALGLDTNYTVLISDHFTARTRAGRQVYELHGTALRPRPGTALPADHHVAWHRQEVFKS
jgi:putative restriction endonuclease